MAVENGIPSGRKGMARFGHLAAAGAVILALLLFFLLRGEHVYLGLPDNLELFQAQYQMLKNTGTFFDRGAASPHLAAVTRDDLPSEFSLTGIVYWLLPALTAYHVNYCLRLCICVLSFCMLTEDLTGEKAEGRRGYLAAACGLAYGLTAFFPAFGIPFAAIPLALSLFLRLEKSRGKQYVLWLLALCVYPFLSYFSYFGLFILAYAGVYWLVSSIVSRRINWKVLGGIVGLSAGFVLMENRLFAQMLFSDTVTIRSTMEIASFSAGEVLKTCVEGFFKGLMHAESAHRFFVMPVCLLGLAVSFVLWLTGRKESGDTLKPLAASLLVLVFNAAIYGLYYWEDFRGLVEMLLPPLTGWQFGRTIFFSPFLWFLMLLVICLRLDKKGKAGACLALFLACAATGVTALSPATYNDLRTNGAALVKEVRSGGKLSQMDYGEFYSEALFAAAKKDLGWREGDFSGSTYRGVPEEDYAARTAASGGDWAAAYGFYPAVLEYNGIATVDGYLGFYPQSYKEAFRRVIAPALETNEGSRQYYDTWGARCYLYSGSGEIVVSGQRYHVPADRVLKIDPEALRAIGCHYIFSAVPLDNAEELSLTLRGTYEDENSPYTLYVYGL